MDDHIRFLATLQARRELCARKQRTFNRIGLALAISAVCAFAGITVLGLTLGFGLGPGYAGAFLTIATPALVCFKKQADYSYEYHAANRQIVAHESLLTPSATDASAEEPTP